MKIAVCIPVHGDVKAGFLFSLSRMLIATMAARINYNGAIVQPTIEMIIHSSANVAEGRCRLADIALGWGADYILWADADHVFPPNALIRLLAHNLPVIGVNYTTRTEPVHFTATAIGGQRLVTDPGRPPEQVMHLGFGLCLVKAQVLKDLPRPLFRFDYGTGGSLIGEDAYFFWKLKEAGVPAYVDHALSAEIGHIGERVFTCHDVEGTDADAILPSAGAQ